MLETYDESDHHGQAEKQKRRYLMEPMGTQSKTA